MHLMSILMSKSSKGIRRTEQVNKELLTKFRHKKEVCRRWKKKQVT